MSVGLLYFELDLDTTKFVKKQNDLNEKIKNVAKDTDLALQKSYDNLKVTADAVYKLQANLATASYERIANAAKQSFAEQTRAAQAYIAEINKINSQMANSQSFGGLGIRSAEMIAAEKANMMRWYEQAKTEAAGSASEIVRIEAAKTAKIQALDNELNAVQIANDAKQIASAKATADAEIALMEKKAASIMRYQAMEREAYAMNDKFNADSRTKAQNENANYWNAKRQYESNELNKSQQETADYWNTKRSREKQELTKSQNEQSAYWMSRYKYESDIKKKQLEETDANYKTLGMKSAASINEQITNVQKAATAQQLIVGKGSEDWTRIERAKNDKLKELNKEMTGDHEMSMASMTRAVLRFYAAYYVISTVVQVVGSAFMSGIKAIDEMKVSTIGVAAQITTMQGTTGDIAKNYKENLQYAEALIPVLQQVDANSFANLSQIQKMNMAMSMQGTILDVNNQKQIESFTALTNAVALFTQGQDKEKQASQEIRALFSGHVREGNMVALMIDQQIKKTGEYKDGLKGLVEEGRKYGDTVERLKPYLVGIIAASGDIQATWMAVSSSIETTWNIMRRGLFKDAYKSLVESGQVATAWLKANQDEVVQYIKIAWGFIADAFTAAWNVLKGFAPIMKDMAMLLTPIAYGWGGVLAAMKPIGEFLGNSIALTYELGKAIIGIAMAGSRLAVFDYEGAKLYWNDVKKNYGEVEKLAEKNKKIIVSGIADSIVAYDKQYEAAKKSIGSKVTAPIIPTGSDKVEKDSVKDHMESLRAKMQADKAYYDEQVKTADQVAKLAQRAGQDEYKTIKDEYDTKETALNNYLKIEYENADKLVALEKQKALIGKDGESKKFDATVVLQAKYDEIYAKYNKEWAKYEGERAIANEDAAKMTISTMANLYKTIDQYSQDSLNTEIAAMQQKKKEDSRYATAATEQRKVLDAAYAASELALRNNSALAKHQIELTYLEMVKGAYSESYKLIFEQQIQKEADLMAIKMQSLGVVFDREEFLANKRRERDMKELSDKANFYSKIIGYEDKYYKQSLELIKKQQIENTKLYGAEAANAKAKQDIGDLDQKMFTDKSKQVSDALGQMSNAFTSISSMYDENSAEYARMQEAAKAMIVLQQAVAVANAVAAIANQGLGDPYTAFARIAAMAAAMGGLLASTGMSLGGSVSISAPSAAYGQNTTVLGGANSEASQSIQKSWELMQNTYNMEDTHLTGIYNEMKQLNANITGIVKGIVQGGVGSLAGSGLGEVTEYPGWWGMGSGEWTRGIPVIGNIIAGVWKFFEDIGSEILGGLFGGGTTVTKAQTGSGISVGGGTVRPYASGTTTTETSGGFWGLFGGGSSSTSSWKEYGAINETLANLFYGERGIYPTLRKSVADMARMLGGDVAKAENKVFAAFELNLSGMSSDAIEKAVSGQISAISDAFVQEIFATLIKSYQEVGEGAYETISRLAIDLLSVTDILDMTGQHMSTVASESVALSESLISLAGGLDKLKESAATYYDKFYKDTEKQIALQGYLSNAMASMNLVFPSTRLGYRSVVEALDLTTTSGQQAYTTMLNMASSADEYYSAVEDATGANHDFVDSLVSITKTIDNWLNNLKISDLAPVQSYAEYSRQYQMYKTAASGQNATGEQVSDYLSYATKYLEFQKNYGTTGSYKDIYDAVVADVEGMKAGKNAALEIAQQQLDVLNQIAVNTDIGAQQSLEALAVQKAAEAYRQQQIDSALSTLSNLNTDSHYAGKLMWGGNPSVLTESDYMAFQLQMKESILTLLHTLGAPGYAEGGYAEGLYRYAEKGHGEYIVPTHEPQRKSFLKTVGADPETLGAAIGKYLQSSNGGSGGQVIENHIYIDGKEIRYVVTKGMKTDFDLIASTRKAVNN